MLPPAPVEPAPVPMLVSAAPPVVPALIEFVPVVDVSVVVVLSAALLPQAARLSEATAIVQMVTIRISYILVWLMPAPGPSVTSAVPPTAASLTDLGDAAARLRATVRRRRAVRRQCR